MKKIFKLFLVIVMTFMMTSSVMAKEVDHFKGVVDNKAVIEDDVKGSSAAIGNDAEMKGKTEGVSFIIGNTVTFNGDSEYLVAAGNSLDVKGGS